MDKSYIKKQKLTKYVGKKYNFQVISLKLELEILEKLLKNLKIQMKNLRDLTQQMA